MSEQEVRAKLLALGFKLEPVGSLVSLRRSTQAPSEPTAYMLQVGANDVISEVAISVLKANGFAVEWRGKTMDGDLYVIWADKLQDVIFYMPPKQLPPGPYRTISTIDFDMPTFQYHEESNEGHTALVFELTPEAVIWMLQVAKQCPPSSHVAFESTPNPNAVKAFIYWREVWL